MPDQAPPAPAPVVDDVSAQLDTARAAGNGMGYIKLADQLEAAGHTLPYQHRKWVGEVRAAVGRARPADPVGEAMLRGGISPADARDAAAANSLLRAGVDPEKVVEAMGDRHPDDWYDDRTPAQIEHDRAHGMTPAVDARSYHAPMPGIDPKVGPSPADSALDTDARGLAASLNLNPQAGASFMKTVYAAGTELGQSADPGMLRQQWEQQLAQIYPGDKLAAATREVDDLLREYGGGNNTLIKRLRERGALRNPALFVALRNRALSLAAWRNSRP
jgi:hypothetical protein